MIYLTKEDYFEVYLASMISTIDRDTLIMLYQPIIGHDAISMYLSLYAEFKKQEFREISTHEELIINMDISLDKLNESRRLLEGIGLIRTYYKKDEKYTYFKYVLYAPKSPSEFFNDVLLKGLLVRNIGEKRTNQIANIYKSKQLDLTSFNEISDSFTNVFHPDLDSNAFFVNIDNDRSFKHKTLDISKGFSIGDFLKTMEMVHQIKENVFKKEDLVEISRIALLYGIEEVVMCDFVSQGIDANGNIDFEMVKKLAIRDLNFAPIRNSQVKSNDIFSGNSNLAKKHELMATTSAIDYLKIKQNNGAISPSDIKLINDLSNDYGLTSQVINPLIDYVLENYDNRLPRSLVLKIGATLARNQIQSTIDAMNYLYKTKNYSKKETPNKVEKNENNVTIEDINKLLEEVGDD